MMDADEILCFVCKRGLTEGHDIHADRTTFSKTLFSAKLCRIIQSPIRRFTSDNQEIFHYVCTECAALLNDIDECEIKLTALESEVKLKHRMPFSIEVHDRGGVEGALKARSSAGTSSAAANAEDRTIRVEMMAGSAMDSAAYNSTGQRQAPVADDLLGADVDTDVYVTTASIDDGGDEVVVHESVMSAHAGAVVEDGGAGGDAMDTHQLRQVLQAAGASLPGTYSIEVVDADGNTTGTQRVSLAAAGDKSEEVVLLETTGEDEMAADDDFSAMELADGATISYILSQDADGRTVLQRPRRRRWGNSQGYMCAVCSRVFTSFEELQAHGASHEDRVEYFQCRYCPRQFRTNIQLHRHQQATHRDRMMPCPHCDKHFPAKSHLTRHLAIHGEPKFVCQVCARPFHSKGDLGKHVLFRHTTEKTVPCPNCDNRFKTVWMMKRHQARVHSRVH